MTKQCDELRDLLSGYRDGELSAEDAHRVAGHLAECVECATALTSDQEVEEIVAESVVPRTSSEWDALTMGIQRALEEEANRRQRAVERLEARETQRHRWRRFLRGLTPRRLAFGGAGTIAIAALVFLLQPWQRELSLEGEVPPVELASEAVPREETPAVESLADRPTEVAEEEAPVVARDSREKLSQSTAKDATPRTGRVAAPKPAPPPPAPTSDYATKRSRTGSPGFIAREIVTEPVKVVMTAPPPGASEPRIETGGPAFAAAPPPGGAQSMDEVQFWLGAPAGGAASSRLTADADAAAPSTTATSERALSRALALISQGERERGRVGLVLLTGDFPGNVVRERAWTRLISLDVDTAFSTQDPGVILPLARSMDAFLETYPLHENAESIREQQVRVWARLATADPTYCAAALERAKAWEASLGSWVPFETRMVVARMRDGPCSE